MADYEYLDNERKKLWEKLLQLESSLKKKTSDYEAEAKDAAERAKAFSEKASDLVNQANSIASSYEEIATKYPDIKEKLETISAILDRIQEFENRSATLKGEIEKINKDASEKSEELQDIYDSKDALIKKFSELEATISKATDFASKAEAANKIISQRKEQIDEVYYEIYGYVETDEKTQKEKNIPGLKDQLADSYKQIKADSESIKEDLEETKISFSDFFNTFKSQSEAEGSAFNKKWTKEFSDLKKRIEDLLPDALTAGLSHAYSAKKDEEILENKKYLRAFNWAVVGMIVISTIPFAISLQSIKDGLSLNDAILRIPKIVLSIIPLYIPALWIAYSNNRKSNLSKRLIEEYSHKEVLSKTYEGLSKQISSLGGSPYETDLKIKLLYNVLEVSSENPGKLISDYNKSDHPLMDALDKSVKLTNAVERLGRIPGFTKLANKLAQKSEDILDKQAAKAESGIEAG